MAIKLHYRGVVEDGFDNRSWSLATKTTDGELIKNDFPRKILGFGRADAKGMAAFSGHIQRVLAMQIKTTVT